jgi:hypothetical protein
MQRDEVDARRGAWDDSYTVDMAAEIDKPHEVLAEVLGVTPDVALRLAEWAASFATVTSEQAAASQLREIVANLLPGARGAVEVRVGGLVAASGVMIGTGGDTMAAIAKLVTQRCKCEACGHVTTTPVTRAAISHQAVLWRDKLGLENFRLCRDDETREANKVAREHVVRGGIN